MSGLANGVSQECVDLLSLWKPDVLTDLLFKAVSCQHAGSQCLLTGVRCCQVEESLNDMDFQLLLDLYFTDGDYT